MDTFAAAVNAADEAHNANVARGATDAELKASYIAALRAHLAMLIDGGEVDGARALKAEIERASR